MISRLIIRALSFRRRFTLTPAAQQAHALLNIAFWPDNPPLYDPSHHSSVMSAVFLALVSEFSGGGFYRKQSVERTSVPDLIPSLLTSGMLSVEHHKVFAN